MISTESSSSSSSSMLASPRSTIRPGSPYKSLTREEDHLRTRLSQLSCLTKAAQIVTSVESSLLLSQACSILARKPETKTLVCSHVSRHLLILHLRIRLSSLSLTRTLKLKDTQLLRRRTARTTNQSHRPPLSLQAATKTISTQDEPLNLLRSEKKAAKCYSTFC